MLQAYEILGFYKLLILYFLGRRTVYILKHFQVLPLWNLAARLLGALSKLQKMT